MPDNEKLLKALDTAIEDFKTQKQAKKDSTALIKAIQGELVGAMTPALNDLIKGVGDALKKIKISAPEVKVPSIEIPEIQVPKIEMPPINIPQPKVTVKAPQVNVPQTKVVMPDSMNVMGEVSIKGMGAKTPLPVQMMGTDGKPLIMPTAGGSSRSNFIAIKDILTKDGDSMVDETNDALNVNVVAGSLSANTEYNDGATPDQSGGTGILTMLNDGGSIQSWLGSSYGIGQVQLSGFDGSIIGITGDALDVNIKSGSSAGTEYNDEATPDQSGGTGTLSMVFDGGSVQSWHGSSYGIGRVEIVDFDGSAATLNNNISQYGGNDVPEGREIAENTAFMRVQHATDLGLSATVNGTTTESQELAENTTGFLRTLQATDLGVSVDVRAYGGNDVPEGREIAENTAFMRVQHATDLGTTADIRAYGGNTVPEGREIAENSAFMRVQHATDLALSTQTEGKVANDAADSGNPIKIGGKALTTNPTAVATGDRVDARFDVTGRQVMTPYQVRDLISTASVTIGTNNADETTLISAGGAGVYLDLMQVVASNGSTNAISIFLMESAGGTAAVQLVVPAESTAGFVPAVPYPQGSTNNAWEVDWDTNENISDRRDVTNTDVKVNATFIKNV